MNTLPSALHFQSHSSDYYELSVNHFLEETKITMSLSIPQVNTIEFPKTLFILQTALPSVLETMCFNDLSLPFQKEAKKTEIGHLFEHILLEYLCIEKSLSGIDSEYNGVTSWDWRIDPFGTFHITIDAGFNDQEIVTRSLQKTIELVNFIITSHVTHSN